MSVCACVCVFVCLSITAHGASGGRGLYNRVQSKAGYVSATFHLTTDEQLGVIVGQQGRGACSKVLDPSTFLLFSSIQSSTVGLGREASHACGLENKGHGHALGSTRPRWTSSMRSLVI